MIPGLRNVMFGPWKALSRQRTRFARSIPYRESED